MGKSLSRYNGVIEYKIKNNNKRRSEKSIIGFIFIIIFLISFSITINILLDRKEIYKNEENYTKEEFINIIKDKAIENYSEYGVLPSITIAQAILESSYGNSSLSKEYNNLFGIKANEGYKGNTITFETKENYDETIIASFRAYDSFEDSIEDHGKFLKENIRYTENGLFDGSTYNEQAQSLEDAGYATVKDEEGNKIYAELLIEVIEENNLAIYD